MVEQSTRIFDGVWATTDAVLLMEAKAGMCGSAALVIQTISYRLGCDVRSKCSVVISASSLWFVDFSALLIRMSRPPSCETAHLTSVSQKPSSAILPGNSAPLRPPPR